MSKAAKKVETAEGQTDAETEISPVARVARSQPKQLASQEIHPAGARWQTWEVMAHADHTIYDVRHPRYLWAKHEQIKKGDTVVIKHALAHFVVVLDVVSIDYHTRGIITYTRSADNLNDPANPDRLNKPDAATWRVDMAASDNWRVIDGTYVVQDGFPTERAARVWIAQQRGEA